MLHFEHYINYTLFFLNELLHLVWVYNTNLVLNVRFILYIKDLYFLFLFQSHIHTQHLLFYVYFWIWIYWISDSNRARKRYYYCNAMKMCGRTHAHINGGVFKYENRTHNFFTFSFLNKTFFSYNSRNFNTHDLTLFKCNSGKMPSAT